MTIGWLIWSKKVISGSLQEEMLLIIIIVVVVWPIGLKRCSFYSDSCIFLPLVLSEGVSVDLLQIALEFVLQWVDQQDMTGFLIQQLSSPRDWCQEGHQTGDTTVLNVLNYRFGCGFCRGGKRNHTKLSFYSACISSYDFKNRLCLDFFSYM